VQAALNILPSVTASALVNEGATAAKLGMQPSAGEVAQAIAAQIAAQCHSAGPRSFASLRMTPASLRMTPDEEVS